MEHICYNTYRWDMGKVKDLDAKKLAIHKGKSIPAPQRACQCTGKPKVSPSRASITFQFNQTKAIESLLYLAKEVSDSDIYGICKLLYLADKTSLEKYGRFFFGE